MSCECIVFFEAYYFNDSITNSIFSQNIIRSEFACHFTNVFPFTVWMMCIHLFQLNSIRILLGHLKKDFLAMFNFVRSYYRDSIKLSGTPTICTLNAFARFSPNDWYINKNLNQVMSNFALKHRDPLDLKKTKFPKPLSEDFVFERFCVIGSPQVDFRCGCK